MCFWGYFNNGTYCEEVTAEEIFSQPITQFFKTIPPIFMEFGPALNANDIIQWLMLLTCLFYLALRDKAGLSWIKTLIPTPETRDAAPEPDPAPQPISERKHLEWVGFLVK